MCRNTAAHLGRAENSTGKTQVTLALLQDPENPKKKHVLHHLSEY